MFLVAMITLALLTTVVLSIDTGIGIGPENITIETENVTPFIWMCGHRYVFDDNVQPGRITNGGDEMVERTKNYAFEGEQIMWIVLVMDKNGVEKIGDVYVSVDDEQSTGQEIEANCNFKPDGFWSEELFWSCNARIDEEILTYEDYLEGLGNTMEVYTCLFTVETPESMQGEYWLTANVVDIDNQTESMHENEYWFFNPVIALTLDGLPLAFGNVRPGTVAYSSTILVGNDAEPSSGVMLDMFMTGTDFTDPAHSGAMCPNSNQLALTNFGYYATNGAYGTQNDLQNDPNFPAPGNSVERTRDSEGYVNIEYGNLFSPILYDNAEVIQSPLKKGPYYIGNMLSPGSEMAVTFKLGLPEPCNGDFTYGYFYFWGEAI